MNQQENYSAEDDKRDNTGAAAQDEVRLADQSSGLIVVGIGASAGGLQALQALFDALPDDSGMAFVVVTHMDPERESLLPELLQTHTAMPVRQVHGLVEVRADNVYVVPPNRHIHMTDTHLDVAEFDEPRGRRAPIDHFFRSLAKAHRNAIAIILSGGGTDGAVGVKSIKEQGGLLLVQDPQEAEHDSMPRAAIATGLADVVLPVRQLAEKLIAYRRNGVTVPLDPEALSTEQQQAVYRILTQVHLRTGHDFSQYKRSTILRRIQRRMQLHGYATLERYLGYLRQDTSEAHALFNDLLIGVTNFFRDSDAWQTLAELVVPRLFEDKGQDDAVRTWTIGCATGEEAYSLAILLLEQQDEPGIPLVARPRIQVFASDLDEDALIRAREGLYPEAIEADVSARRLSRFFNKEDGYYRVKRELRDVVLFSNHSVLRDPPFSRLDLISCRNLLIYLQRDLQQNVLQIFHYALNPEAYLFLGSSESADAVNELFHTANKQYRIFQARSWRGGHRQVPTLPLSVHGLRSSEAHVGTSGQRRATQEAPTVARLHLEMLEASAPPSVLIDESYHILHLSRNAGRYLRHPAGELTGDLVKLVRSELRYELRRCLFEAFEGNRMVTGTPVMVQFDGAARRVTVAVQARVREDQKAAEEKEDGRLDSRLALVFFLEDETVDPVMRSLEGAGEPPEEQDGGKRDALLAQMEAEAQRLRERLQAVSEEYESSHEELKASNEELQSINEEYRSTTEELETSQEELQSVNEELQTVNSELKNKLEEISRAHSDLENLMGATDVAMLFLDRQLRIQRYTPSTADLFNIRDGDQGRPLTHLTHKLEYDALEADARKVMRTLAPVERKVRRRTAQDGEEAWFLARTRPYITVDDRIDGVVVTFVDISNIKAAEKALSASRERYRLLVENTKEYAMLTKDTEGFIETWNQGAERIFGYREEEVRGKTGDIIFTADDQDAGVFREEMGIAREEGEASDERWHVRKDGSRFWASGVLTSLWDGDRLRGYAKVLRDNTVRKEAEEALRRSKEALEALNETLEEKVEERTQDLKQRTQEVRALAAQLAVAEQEERARIAQVLHEDLQQRLYAIQLQLDFVQSARQEADVETLGKELAAIEKELKEAIRTTRQLSVDLSPPILHDEGLAEAIAWLARQMEEQFDLQVMLEAEGSVPIPDEGLRVLFFQAVRELLFNVVKHADVLEAAVQLRLEGEDLVIIVTDQGAGFDSSIQQNRSPGGTGLGTISRRLNLVGGSMNIETSKGCGTHVSIRATLPERDTMGA